MTNIDAKTPEGHDGLLEAVAQVQNGDGTPPVVAEVVQSLQKNEEIAKEVVVPSTQPVQFDLTSFTVDQLQALKQALNATPDSATRKKENPTVMLRTMNGNVILDFKNAYLGLVEDPENRRQVERHLIPVLVTGSKDYVSIRYTEFMQLERVKGEIISTRKENDDRIEGTVVSNETGRPTEMLVKRTKDFFTIKLEGGQTLEIESKMANA
jgi:hypothetical protein